AVVRKGKIVFGDQEQIVLQLQIGAEKDGDVVVVVDVVFQRVVGAGVQAGRPLVGLVSFGYDTIKALGLVHKSLEIVVITAKSLAFIAQGDGGHKHSLGNQLVLDEEFDLVVPVGADIAE